MQTAWPTRQSLYLAAEAPADDWPARPVAELSLYRPEELAWLENTGWPARDIFAPLEPTGRS